MTDHTLPVVLCIGGQDPSGGAGIQADIESIAANGGHAAAVITCLTVQDSCDVTALYPVSPKLLAAQFEAVCNDCEVAAIKIGLIGDVSLAKTLAGLLQRHPGIPLVLDPVLASGAGSELASGELLQIIHDQLLPLTTLITPNSLEARRLCPTDAPLSDCAKRLLNTGARAVLITGTHEHSRKVTNRLYDSSGLLDEAHWQRLPGEYHGSGCTLASAISAGLAQGLPLIEAVRCGQDYTWQTLNQGFRTGRCQALPDRLFTLKRGHT